MGTFSYYILLFMIFYINLPLRLDAFHITCIAKINIQNLSPNEKSRTNKRRIARGYSGNGGGTGERGSRGQKSRSGGGIRLGFQGGQMLLYKRLPKLKGIAGGT